MRSRSSLRAARAPRKLWLAAAACAWGAAAFCDEPAVGPSGAGPRAPVRRWPADARGLALVARPGRTDEELAAPGLGASLAAARGSGADALLVPIAVALCGEGASAASPWTMPGPAALANVLSIAREQGFALALEFELLASLSGGRAADQVLTSTAEWQRYFDDQQAALLHVARIAEAHAVELLIVGAGLGAAASCSAEPDAPALEAELAALRRARWASTVAELRGAFGGELAYAEGWGTARRSRMDWSLFDRVAGEAFEPLGASGRRPQPAEVDARWREQLADLAALGAANGKPALVAGIGASATAACWSRPAGRAGPPDESAQAFVLEALARAWPAARAAHPELDGIFVWSWSADPGGASARDAGHSVARVTARAALAALFAPAR
jgi:hypothetical protein